jgi:hypothetical protein
MGSFLKPGKLVRHSDTLYSTHYTYYSKRHRELTRKYAPRLSKDLVKIEEELSLTGHKIILRPLKDYYNGITFASHKLVYIDPRRRSYPEVLRTLVHECLHLKQIQDKVLRWDRKKLSLIWEKKVFSVMDLISADLVEKQDIYNSLPWEIDVNEKEGDLYYKITGKRKLPKIRMKVGQE